MQLAELTVVAIASGAFAFGGAWCGLHYRLKWIERSLKRAHERIDQLTGVDHAKSRLRQRDSAPARP